MRITLSFDDNQKHVVLHVLDTDKAVADLRKRGLSFVADAVEEAAALGQHVLDKHEDAQAIALDEAGIAENAATLAHASDKKQAAAAAAAPETK